MQVLPGGNNHLMSQVRGLDAHHAGHYQQLLPIVRQVLELLLENDFEDSSIAVTQYVADFRFRDGTHMSYWIDLPCTEYWLRGKVLEALVYWIDSKARILDRMIPLCQQGLLQQGAGYLPENLQDLRRRLEQVCYQSSPNEVIVEFIYSLVVECLGRDAGCLGSALGSMVLPKENVLPVLENPATLLAFLVKRAEEITSKASKAVMEIFVETGELTYDRSQERMLQFFQYFTVNTNTGTSDVHATPADIGFVESGFRINLIDSFGGLMDMLLDIEKLRSYQNGFDASFAVDFEGKASSSGWNRYGELCLMQITISDQPMHTFVLDIHKLGKRAFTLQAPGGTSIKGVLEDERVRKVWWDCRSDIDVLWNHFEIFPKGIFDLQLGEVACRRSCGIEVRFVLGLQKALMQSPSLEPEQKSFAETIDQLGKNLYEPNYGGNYDVFQNRPLNPIILIYAAHDTRYQLVLYEQYMATIGAQWASRVLGASDLRSRWGLSHDYVEPSAEAPDF